MEQDDPTILYIERKEYRRLLKLIEDLTEKQIDLQAEITRLRQVSLDAPPKG